MSIASRITNMTENISNAYDRIEYLGVDLTNTDKNLENLSDTLDEIYNNYPKVTGSGTEVNLSGTKKGRIDIGLKGNTSQGSTTGKNMFNVNSTIKENTLSNNGVTLNINQDGTISTSGTNTGTYKYIKYDITLPAGTYYFCGCPSGGNINSYSTIVQTGSTTASQVYDTGNGNTFTLSEQTTVHFYPVRVGSDTVNFDGLVFKPIISAVQVSYNDYEPYTGGTASPNPDYPQTVHTVTGNNTVKVEGKNLCNLASGTQTQNDYVISSSNNIINVTSTNNKFAAFGIDNILRKANYGNYIEWGETTLNAGTYTLSYKYLSGSTTTTTQSGNSARVIVYSRDVGSSDRLSTSLGQCYITAENSSVTFTINESKEINIVVYIYNEGTTINTNINFQVQLELGSIDTTFEPYSGVSYNIDLPSLNKNMLDTRFTTIGSINADTGEYVYNANNLMGENYIRVKPNTTYSLSGNATFSGIRLSEYNANKEHVKRSQSNSPKVTITTTVNTYYLRWSFNYNNQPATLDLVKTLEVQLEEGNARTTYVECTPLELCKLDTYQDYIYKNGNKWYKKKYIGRIVLNGSEEGWGLKTSGDRRFDITTSNLNIVVKDNDTNFNSSMLRMSDRFIHRDNNHNYKKWGYYYLYGGWLVLHDSDSTIATLANFKTWLNNYNPKLYYVLATATDTEITDTTLISQLNALYNAKSGNDKTTITQTNADKPFIISASALMKQS